MSLNYGFGLYYGEGSKHRKFWNEKFLALTEAQKKFYHGSLAWLLMGWGIHHISEKTIEEIVHRELDFDWHMIQWEQLPEEITKDKESREKYIRKTLTPMIGYQTNVSFEPIGKWVKRFTWRGMEASKFRSQKAVDKEINEFIKWIKAQSEAYDKEHPEPEPQAQEQQQ